MTFGILNLANFCIVALMLLPNIIYALRHPEQENKCANTAMNLLEQIGRYASMVLMVFPLGVWEFAFPGVVEFLIYLFGNGALLVGYWGFWRYYFREATPRRALALAVLPTCIFFLTGLTLHHWLLVIAAGIFGVGHVWVTRENHRQDPEQF